MHVLKTRIEEWRRKDRPETQAIYERFIWKPGMPSRAAEHFAATGTQEEAQEFLADTFAKLFIHDGIIEFIERMRWRVLSLPEAAPTLLTGDQPMITSNGLDKKDGYLLFPIAPRRMFLATNSKVYANRFVRQKGMLNLARNTNQLITERARRFVYSSDRSHDDFVSERMGTRLVQSVGEKVAMNDPWGNNRPEGYTAEDAVADYVEFVRSEMKPAISGK